MKGLFTAPSRVPARVAVLVLATLFCFTGALQVRAEKGDFAAKKKVQSGVVSIALGKADVIEIDGPVADVMVANPAIVDVTALQANRLYAVGLQPGDTNLIVLDDLGNTIAKLDVHVRMDTVAIQKMVDDLFPEEDIKISTVHDQLLLTGNVSTPVVANKVVNLVASYFGDVMDRTGTDDELIVNMLSTASDQQVMLRVKVLEMSRTALRELGLETSLTDTGNAWSDVSGTLTVDTASGLTADPLGIGTLLWDNGAFGPLQLVIRALEEEGLVNILAEPNLTAISGEQAGFLAGGEFPVPTGRDSDGNIQIEFRSFGVSLNFRPIVVSRDRISLQLQTEVSSLDRDNSVTLADLEVPGLDIRRASTTVEIGSGGSLMIAGLLQSQAVKGLTGLPGIKNTPIIGDLIKSRSFERQETELVVIVTPYMVTPYADKTQANVLPAPEKAPLADAFAANIKRTYNKNDLPQEILSSTKGNFGYLIK